LLLQCVAVWCSVVQCGAVWCSVVQCGAVLCSMLQCVAVHYVRCSGFHPRSIRMTVLLSRSICFRGVSLCVAVCYNVFQCVSVCFSVLQCVAMCCSVLQCVTVCSSMIVFPSTSNRYGRLNLVCAWETSW